jgi:putative tricarboxylic transport membrane protein
MELLVIDKVIGTIISLEGIAALLGGMIVGYIIGIVPAVGQGFALILLMPLAFLIRPEIAFICYASMFGGADLGGSVTSILLGVPGNAANITTILDGYPMARAGQASRAIGLSIGSSIMGSVIGIFALIGIMPLMKGIMYGFGAREYFLSVILAMMLAALATGYAGFTKGIAAGCFGMLCSFVGTDALFGKIRYSGDIQYLEGGVSMVVLVIGLFALSELMVLQSEGESIAQRGMAAVRYSDTLKGVWEAFRSWKTVVKAALAGVIVGCVPGLGGPVAQYVSYWSAKSFAKDKSRFGKGDPQGVIASEAANNARDGASMLPTLFLGIPGGGEMAILLGIFLIFGITPGPGMAMEHLDLVWIIIICLMAGNVIATLLSIAGAPLFSKVTTIPIVLVTAFTVPLCLSSLYSVNSDAWDFAVAGLFGIIGILMKRAKYNLAPVVIGYVLATLAERAFHTSLQSSYYSPFVFVQSPLAIGLDVGIFVAVLIPAVLAIRSHHRKTRAKTRGRGDDLNKREAMDEGSRIESLFVPAAFFIIAATAAAYAPDYNLREAGLWPLSIAMVMLVSSGVVLVSEIRKFALCQGQKGLVTGLKAECRDVYGEWKSVLPPLVWTILYIFAAMVVGIHVADLVCVFALLRVMGDMSVRKAAVWSVIVHVCIYLFFSVLFEIILWPGIIPTIIPNLIGGGSLRPFF